MNPLAPIRAGAAGVLLCLLAACGGGGGGDPPPQPNIGPAGGTVSTADGRVTLTVPAGAVSAPVRVTITAAPEAAGSDPDVIASTVVRVEGNVGALAKPATLTFTTAAAAGRKQAADVYAPGSPCDRDGDGYVTDYEATQAGLIAWIGGTTVQCVAPPQVVILTPAAVEALGICSTASGASLQCTVSSLAAGVLAVKFDAAAPQVTITQRDFPSFPASVTEARTYQFGVAATDNRGVVRVDFVKMVPAGSSFAEQPIASLTAPPYIANFTLGPSDANVRFILARAVDAWGNIGFAAIEVRVQIAEPPPPDTTPPTVQLQASAASATVGGAVTLSATAADDVAVAKVEFFRDGSKLGEDTSAPYSFAPPAFTSADVGSVSYSARAVDTSGNGTASTPVVVTVSAPQAGQAWVSPGGDDAAAGTSAAPFRSLAKAFAVAGPGGLVWLHNGSYTAATEGLAAPDVPVGRTLPAGATLRAVNDGGATLGFTLQAPAGGAVIGLNFDASSSGRVQASGGTLLLQRPQWVKLGAGVQGHGIEASGSARVTLDPKGLASHNYAPTGLTGFASVVDSAELTVDGGVLDGSSGQAGAFALDASAKLTLSGFTLRNDSAAWVGSEGAVRVGGTANVVLIENSTIDLANAFGLCLSQDRQVFGPAVAPSITLRNSTLQRCGGGAVQLREGAPVFIAENSSIVGSGRVGIEAGQVGFDSTIGQYAKPTVTLTGASISGHAQGAVLLNSGGTLVVDGSTLAGGSVPALQLLAVQPYQLKLRNTAVTGSGAGVVLEGSAASVFDLGTAALPGGNTLQAAPGLRLTTAAGVLTTAVGNTWNANVQGAGAGGAYTPASSVCAGANPCDVTAGSGLNFTFQAAGAGAALRLVGP